MIELVTELEAKMVELAKAAAEHVAGEVSQEVADKIQHLNNKMSAISWLLSSFHQAQTVVKDVSELPQALAGVAKQ